MKSSLIGLLAGFLFTPAFAQATGPSSHEQRAVPAPGLEALVASGAAVGAPPAATHTPLRIDGTGRLVELPTVSPGASTAGGQLNVGGPDSLSTLFVSNNGHSGNMFDIMPAVNLRITALDINTDETTLFNDLEVYYREGTAVGNEAAAGWTLLDTGASGGNGMDVPTFVQLPGANVVFKAGKTYGIYVTHSTSLSINYTTGGPSTYANEDLCLRTHSGNSYPFGVVFAPREWNGTVYYDTIPTLNVALAGAESDPASLADVQSKLEATGKFNSIDVLEVRTTTPTLTDLLRYDAILTWTNSNYADATAMGNNLADYVDAGGGVAMAVSANASLPIAGRWITDGYEVIVSGSGQTQGGGPFTLGTVNLPNHPVMKGVASFSGGTSSYRPTLTNLVAGASSICEWSDGRVLAAEGRPGRIDLGFYPTSDDQRADFWDVTTDGDLLMANALCAAAARKPRVLIAASPSVAAWSNEVQAKLVASDKFSVVDAFDTKTGTPTLAQLRSYAAVLTFTDSSPQDAVGLGDVLADYVDAGGGVVSAVFANTTVGLQITGRWVSGGYEVIVGGSGQTQGGGPFTLGTVHLPGHPSMTGVASFSGGTSSYRPTATVLQNGATSIAEWSDGRVLVAEGANRQRIDLGFFPPSTGARADFWDATTDGDKLLCNSLLYVARPRPRVAVVAAESTAGFKADVIAKLQGTGEFSEVDLIDFNTATPSLATLRNYDALLVFTDNSPFDRIAMGDTLADYVDAGGGVLQMFAAQISGHSLLGRWSTGGYELILPTGFQSGSNAVLATVHEPLHPVMSGVSTFDGGTKSFRLTSTTLLPGARSIADWSDGTVLIAAGVHPRRIDINSFPMSSDARADFWVAATHGARMMANALLFVSRGVGGEVGTTYCTAGTTFDGCNATISASGRPSVSKAAGFLIDVTNMPGNKNGILFYGLSGPNAAPWGNSTSFLCVKAPTQRMGLLSSGGSPGTCDGVFQLDWLDYVATHPNKLGVPFSPGCGVWVQAWFRDPAAGTGPVGAKGTATSNGLHFVTCP